MDDQGIYMSHMHAKKKLTVGWSMHAACKPGKMTTMHSAQERKKRMNKWVYPCTIIDYYMLMLVHIFEFFLLDISVIPPIFGLANWALTVRLHLRVSFSSALTFSSIWRIATYYSSNLQIRIDTIPNVMQMGDRIWYGSCRSCWSTACQYK